MQLAAVGKGLDGTVIQRLSKEKEEVYRKLFKRPYPKVLEYSPLVAQLRELVRVVILFMTTGAVVIFLCAFKCVS